MSIKVKIHSHEMENHTTKDIYLCFYSFNVIKYKKRQGMDFMKKINIEIVLYGTDQLCPSCVNLPSSKDTFEWLEAAITRKFPNQPFKMSYVDIHQPPKESAKENFAKRVIEEDMFYPVVVIEEKIVGEGSPNLKTIFSELEKHGFNAK